MTARHSLQQIQAFIWQAVSRPLDLDFSAEDRWIDGNSFSLKASEYVKRNERLSSAERLQIYNQQYWYRLLDCLEDDFPGLRAVLGADGFLALARAYLREHPSRSFSLRDLGSELPEFLDARPQLIEPNVALCRELARFEWAQVVAFDGPSSEPIDEQYILTGNPDTLRVSLQPYITLLNLTHGLDHYSVALNDHSRDRSEAGSSKCEANSSDARLDTAPWPVQEQVYLVVHRLDNTVYLKRIDAPAFSILSALRRGQSLSAALGSAFSLIPEHATSVEALQADVQKSFALWNKLGWLCKPDACETV